MNIADVKSTLAYQLHGSTTNKIRGIEMLLERAADIMLAKISPLSTVRTTALTSTVHDDFYNYALPSDFKRIIDLYPQDNRNHHDTAKRNLAAPFDLQKAIRDKTISIESDNGSKLIRINWRSRGGKTLHQMNDTDDNGTWIAVATATGIVQDTITKLSGNGSVRVDLVASGDGIQNTTMTAVDLTDEDEVADVFLSFYIKNTTDLGRLTSCTLVWGNDVTTAYWTGVAQTAQADGTAFKVGWNTIKVPWSTATETGTVAPATIDSAKVTFATTGAISDIRVENIIFSIGRNFDIKYYSKYLVKNSAGTWLSRSTSDDDTLVLDNDEIQIFHLETLILGAQQIEGSNSNFDIGFAQNQLAELYARYKAEYPSMSKKAINSYGGNPARGRW
jgi:hypothetical protein